MNAQAESTVTSAVSDNKAPVRQFTVFLKNRPGTLLSLVKLMADLHVHVLGLSVQDSSDVTLVRMVVTDPETVETLFIDRGISHSVKEILAVELKEGAVEMNHCLSTLLIAELNVQFCYPLLCRPFDHCVIAISVDDGDIGAEILRNSGFRVLMQTDLSR